MMEAKMQKNVLKLVVLVFICIISQPAFAQEEISPFDLGDPVVQGNGCPEGTYDVLLSPDGTELTLLFNSFTAETDSSSIFDFANCNIAIPLNVPKGITVGLLGVDYRGIAYIPSGGTGTISREYFFAGERGVKQTDRIKVYDDFYEFLYPDELPVVSWTGCGDSTIARSNATIYVTKPSRSAVDSIMSLFSEDWDLSVLFHLEWKHC
jgi:hypothetical protein